MLTTLGVVLGESIHQGERADQNELDNAEPNRGSIPKSRNAVKDQDRVPTIKIEDDEDESRGATGNGKRKATVDIGTENHKNKRVTQNKNTSHPAMQQTSQVEPEVPHHSFSEPPPNANRDPDPAAHIYRNEKGVTIRPKIGWQFREFEGITKVWHDGKWRPLIRDQPDFQGVRETRDGWILPLMAGWNEAPSETRRRWELQGKVEFNSQF